MFSIVVWLASGERELRAQSANDGFDPNANFFVRVVVLQPDGKILVGGDFTSLSPNGGVAHPRNRLVRLNRDGSLDSAFNPNPNGEISSIMLQADGKILIAGEFTTLTLASVARTNFARLNSDGTLDTSFNPNVTGSVTTFALQTDGKILVGGNFSSIGGQTRNRIARLDATTGAADSFNPDASGFGFPAPTVYSIVVQEDGRILVGGGFSSIGGQSRNRIARLDPTTGLADSFNPNADGFTGIHEIAVQPDGKILVGGGFGNIGGQQRNCMARLDPVTGMADSWNPNVNNTVYTMAVQPDGKVLIGGDFSQVGAATTFFARLDPVTGAPDAFNPGANDRVLSIALQPDGKILAGGLFTSMGGLTRNRIARLEHDSRLDRTLNANVAGSFPRINATAVQPDGKILIGGNFTNVLGVTRNNIARLNTDGTLDTVFNPNVNPTSDDDVFAIALQSDGKILVGGTFSGANSIGGQTRNFIARLDPVTGAADSWNPSANTSVRTISVQTDGKIVVGGQFATIGGQSRNRIARLDPLTGLADSFNPNADNWVYALAVQADGKILAGGDFSQIGGQARRRVARLDAATGLADSFGSNIPAPPGFPSVHSLAVQADGKILIGGSFTNIAGQTRTNIARLDAVTGLADSWNPNAKGIVTSIAVQSDGKIVVGGSFSGANSIGGQQRSRIARLGGTTGLADSWNPNSDDVVYSIAIQADGKILAGGTFTTIGQQARSCFARLNNDTDATHNLSALSGSATWTRGGSSPQFTRVSFEYSTNNVNYVFLGNGTTAGNNWTLNGLTFPIGQNLYLRARGSYRSGHNSGSESVIESVSTVFFAPSPPHLNIQRSETTNVVLSWATNFTGFTLESKTNLNTNVWSSVSPAPVVSGTNNVVTNAVSGAARFYRLRQ